MEKLTSVKHGKRSPRSSKKKPVKVVYISNPMKIKATPSEFRAVVQQLTGRYATATPPGGHARVVKKDDDTEEEAAGCADGGGGFVRHQEKWQRTNSTSMDARCTTGSDLSYESGRREDQVMDDLMLESFPPLLPSDFGSYDLI